MKACMVAYTYYEADTRVRRYAESLAGRGDEVDVLVLKRPGQSGYGELNGVRIQRIQSRVVNERSPMTYLAKLLLFFIRSALVLARNTIRGKYDVVHVHSVPDFEVFAAIVPKLFGSKIILDIHDIIPEFYVSKFNKSRNSWIFRLLVVVEKMSIMFADHVIIANHIWYETLLSRSVEAGKCSVVLNYPDVSIFRRIPKSRNDGNSVMLYPGSLNWHQGVDVAIRAFAKIAAKFPRAEFHIFGDGAEREALVDLTKQLELVGRVRFFGMCPMEDIAAAMANADVGVVPKRAVSFGNEAFSTKIPEFMAIGIPVIASSTKVDRFYFNDSQILFFKSEDEHDLAAKMETLLTNPELAKRLVENSTIYIRGNNWDVRRNEYFELLSNLS